MLWVFSCHAFFLSSYCHAFSFLNGEFIALLPVRLRPDKTGSLTERCGPENYIVSCALFSYATLIRDQKP
jgi:hypothetical protein